MDISQPPIDPHTGLPNGTTAISYRSEPMRNRLPLGHHADHTDTDEDISMSSWAYGDPAPPILKAYVGDPSKIRLIHGGVKETHVFHLHNHQWRLEPDDPKSAIIDSISISPQECYTLDILYGAGSFNGMIGDAIFHCHLYPHFHEGMWTLWRVFDRLQDGSGVYPDGTPIEAPMPLECGVSFAPTLSKMTICSRSAADAIPSARRPRRRMRLSAALKSPPYKRILFTTASEIMIRRA